MIAPEIHHIITTLSGKFFFVELSDEIVLSDKFLHSMLFSDENSAIEMLAQINASNRPVNVCGVQKPRAQLKVSKLIVSYTVV